MSRNPQYLVHSQTGRVFSFSAALASRADLQLAPDMESANALSKRLGGEGVTPRTPDIEPEGQPTLDAVGGDVASSLQEQIDALHDRVTALESGGETRSPSLASVADAGSSQAAAAGEPVSAGGDASEASVAGQSAGNEPPEDNGESDDAFVISTADKNELEAFAKAEYNVDIDKRKSLDKLRAEVAELAGA